MDFIESLARYLIGNETIKAVVSGRVYPQVLPQQCDFPSIMYTPTTVTYDNALQVHTGFVRQMVQLSIHDKTFGKARQVGHIVRQVLQDYSGDMCGVHVQATHTISDIMSTEDNSTIYNTSEYVNILEFEFQYMEVNNGNSRQERKASNQYR